MRSRGRKVLKQLPLAGHLLLICSRALLRALLSGLLPFSCAWGQMRERKPCWSEGSLESLQSSLLLRARPAGSGCSGTCPLEVWISSRVEIFLIPKDGGIRWRCDSASPQEEEHPLGIKNIIAIYSEQLFVLNGKSNSPTVKWLSC